MRLRLAFVLVAAVTLAGMAWGIWTFWRADEYMPPLDVEMPGAVPDAGPVRSLPGMISLDSSQVELGRRLFQDVRLSADDTVSCASCHPLDRFGVDGKQVSRGVQGKTGDVNAPTVYNSGFNFRQFWDGRAATLEEQAGGPVQNPLEMASNWPQVLAKLRKDGALRVLARRAYGREIDERMVREAIAIFERGLITPDSPFDRYLLGETQALDKNALRGWQRFRELGCIACHQGINFGGNMYATLGAMNDYFVGRQPSKSDLGLYNLTRREADRHKFKVPSLRNVAMTAPYFHDGRIATLDEAVEMMARLQLGLELASDDRTCLVAFLKSLTGIPKGAVRESE